MSTEPTNNAPEEKAPEPNSEGNIYYVPRKDYQPSEEVRNRGFHNGILRVDPEAYLTFLQESEKKNRLARYVRFLQEEIARKQADLYRIRAQKEQYERDQIEGQNGLATNAEKERVVKEQKSGLEAQKLAYKEKREAVQPLYGWLATALYLIAGFVFMGTDYSITKSIASETLDMSDGTEAGLLPFGEATIFALGLAFLAFVFKPAVDRIFEQPYFQEKRRKRMFVFLSLVAILAITNLAVMGSYRKTAWRANNILEELRKERDELLNDIVVAEKTVEVETKLSQIKKDIIAQEEQIDSGEVRGIFILSSILFAVAGAICFSISLPLARQHSSRVRFWFLSNRMDKKIKASGKLLDQLLMEKTSLLNAKSIAELRLPELPVIADLEEELKETRTLEQDIVRAIYDHHTSAQSAWYIDNYQRGTQYYPADGDHSASIVIQNGDETLGKWGLVRDPDKAKQAGDKGRSHYLYQQIRDYINEEVNEGSSRAQQNGVH